MVAILAQGDRFGLFVVLWFACARHGPFNHNNFIRWSAEVDNSWMSQQDGFRFSVALVPKRRSGQRQRGKVRRHQAMAEVVGGEVLNKEEFPNLPGIDV